MDVRPNAPKRRPNILFVVGETVSSNEWAPWNPKSDASPELAAFLAAHESWVTLEGTVSGGSATDISVPSMLTGIATTASIADYRRAPVIWQEAKARGYRTGLFSPQNFHWLHFDEFFLSDHPPDVVRTSVDFPGSPVNDGGPPDERVVASALEFMTAPSSEPFFAVLQFNATHFPYWAPGLEAIEGINDIFKNDRLGRRPRSLRYVSELLAGLFRDLEAKGILDETFVVMTADHGAGTVVIRVSRIESNYEDVLRVPMAVHLPASFARENPSALVALRANAAKRTSNSDIVPTLLDVWGSWTGAPVPDRPAFVGSSLLAPMEDDRSLLVMSTGPIRTWRRRGFALYLGKKKWLVDEQEGVAFFDLVRDPNEATNLAASATPEERNFLVERASRVEPARVLLEQVAPQLLRTSH